MKFRLPICVRPALFDALWFFTGALASAQAPARPVSVIFETELGPITLEVDVAHAPVTSANFLRYVDGKFYDGGQFIRAVRHDNTVRHDVEIQGIQAGSNPARDKELFPPIPLERTTVTGLKHLDGTISMARGEPNSATSSFWIAIGDQLSLDFGGSRNPDGQGFATFGRVIRGMDVVKRIQAAHTGTEGAFRTETLQPAIRILRAHRATP
ncbi:MAG: peptidylprolyl isomerase [Gemmatimonadales bacterium]